MKKNTTKTRSLSKGVRILFTMLILFVCQQSFSQIVFQSMRMIGESPKHVDVFGSIVRCDTFNQIHLKVINESRDTQNVVFDLIVSNNETGKKFSKEVSIKALAPAKALNGGCSSSYTNLTINLPKEYKPSKTSLTITF